MLSSASKTFCFLARCDSELNGLGKACNLDLFEAGVGCLGEGLKKEPAHFGLEVWLLCHR